MPNKIQENKNSILILIANLRKLLGNNISFPHTLTRKFDKSALATETIVAQPNKIHRMCI